MCFINSPLRHTSSCWLGVPISWRWVRTWGIRLQMLILEREGSCFPACLFAASGDCWRLWCAASWTVWSRAGAHVMAAQCAGRSPRGLAIPAAVPQFISLSDPTPAPHSLCWSGAWNPAWRAPPRLVPGCGSVGQSDPEYAVPLRSVLGAFVGHWSCFLFPRSLIDLVV